MQMIDETGNRFGLLDVLAIDYTPVGKRKDAAPGAHFFCQCACGMVITAPGLSLRKRRATGNCGCVQGNLPREGQRISEESLAYLQDSKLLKRAVSGVQVYRSTLPQMHKVMSVPDTVDELLGTNLGRQQFFTLNEDDAVTITLVITHTPEDVRVIILTNKAMP